MLSLNRSLPFLLLQVNRHNIYTVLRFKHQGLRKSRQKSALQKYDKVITSKYLNPFTKDPIRILAFTWVMADLAKPVVTAMHLRKGVGSNSNSNNMGDSIDSSGDSRFAAIANNIGFSFVHIVVYWGLYFSAIGALGRVLNKKLANKVSKQTKDFTVQTGTMIPLSVVNATIGTTLSAQITQWLITERKNNNPLVVNNPVINWLLSLGSDDK